MPTDPKGLLRGLWPRAADQPPKRRFNPLFPRAWWMSGTSLPGDYGHDDGACTHGFHECPPCEAEKKRIEAEEKAAAEKLAQPKERAGWRRDDVIQRLWHHESGGLVGFLTTRQKWASRATELELEVEHGSCVEAMNRIERAAADKVLADRGCVCGHAGCAKCDTPETARALDEVERRVLLPGWRSVPREQWPACHIEKPRGYHTLLALYENDAGQRIINVRTALVGTIRWSYATKPYASWGQYEGGGKSFEECARLIAAADKPACAKARAAGLSAAWKHVDDASYERIDGRAKVYDTGSPASPDWCLLVDGKCRCEAAGAPTGFMRKPSEAAALADRYLAARGTL